MKPGSVDMIFVESAVVWIESSRQDAVVDKRYIRMEKESIEVENILGSEKFGSWLNCCDLWIPTKLVSGLK